jgi:hypothetical protein
MRLPQKETLRAQRGKAFRFRGAKELRGARQIGKAGVHWIVKRDWAPEPDPALIVDHIRDVVLAAIRDAIRTGQKADGSGPQPPQSAIEERLAKMTPAGAAGLRRKLESEGKLQTGRAGKYRGFDTGYLADNLSASAIRVQGGRRMTKSVLGAKEGRGRRKAVLGTRAASTIYMAGISPESLARSKFLSDEAERGVYYLYTTGQIARLVDLAVDQAIEVAFLEGGSRDARMGALKAKDAIHSK